MRLPFLRARRGAVLPAIIIGVPVIAFLIAIGATLATNSDDAQTVTPLPTAVDVQVRAEPTPTAPPATPEPLPTSVIRANCSLIRGSEYASDDERRWFQANCPEPTAAPAPPSRPVVQAPVVNQADTSSIYGTADRFVISRLGVDAPVNIRVVEPDGVMGNPVGGNDVVLYDFSSIPGLGGYPGQGGNTVIAGHVDYICCLAVFAPLRNIREGDVIDYYTGEGGHFRYVVEWFGDFPPDTNWGGLVNGGPDIMTLITCNGTFDTGAREYSHRRVVRAVLESDAAAAAAE